MRAFAWIILCIFLGIGGFGFHAGVAKLFVAGIIGVVSVLLNLLFEDHVFCRVISNTIMLATLAYAVVVATNTALQIYF